MADSEDLKRLRSGELDLSRCDFREAKLEGMDLRGRNFSHSLFQKADCNGARFDDPDFQGAQVSFMLASNATFDRCNLERLHFGYTDLTNASLTDVTASEAIFQHVKLNGADLSGAVLRDGQMDADTVLTDVISSPETDFEGLRVLRPTSRDPLFRAYTFDNGILRRKSDGEPVPSDYQYEPEMERASEQRDVIAAKEQIQHLLRNAIVTRVTALQFASQIEDALSGVPATHENKLAEPLQTMLEFADVLRRFAPENQPLADPLERAELMQRVVELETLVKCLTQQLSDETKARESAEALAKSDGFMANFRRSAGKASGNAAVVVASTLVTVGVPAAAVYFLGADHPVVTPLLTAFGRLSK